MTLALRILRFPLTRLLIAACALGGTWYVVQILLVAAEARNELGDPVSSPHLESFATAAAFALVYVLYVLAIERRPVRELSLKGAPLELLAGGFLGAGLFTMTIVSIWAAGGYDVSGWNGVLAAAPALSLSLGSGFTEEGLGTWSAIAISSSIFGLAHMGNPNATAFSVVAIALEAGVLLAAAYILTRRLWLAIGLHAAWNFVQGGVFGVAVSGHAMGGLLSARLSGPDILSGGEFGAETSVFAVIYCLAAGAFLLVKAHGLKRFVALPWRRPAAAAAPPVAC
jgi:membrane protease YdiL (CAAX protease family)